jgi:hypothetical protein
MSNTSSYSSTGGNVVGTGGSVSNGQSGTSAYSENIVNSNSDGGSSATVQIETDNNGVVQQQTITKEAPPGGSIDIEVATSSGGSSVNIASYVSSGPANAAGTPVPHGRFTHQTPNATTSIAASSSIELASTVPVMDLGTLFRSFFTHLFSFFGL